MSDPTRFRFSLGNLLGMMMALGFILMACSTLDVRQGPWISFGKVVLGLTLGVGMLLQFLFSGKEGVRGALLFGLLSLLLVCGLAGWFMLLVLIIERFGNAWGYVAMGVYIGTTILALWRPWRGGDG